MLSLRRRLTFFILVFITACQIVGTARAIVPLSRSIDYILQISGSLFHLDGRYVFFVPGRAMWSGRFTYLTVTRESNGSFTSRPLNEEFNDWAGSRAPMIYSWLDYDLEHQDELHRKDQILASALLDKRWSQTLILTHHLVEIPPPGLDGPLLDTKVYRVEFKQRVGESRD